MVVRVPPAPASRSVQTAARINPRIGRAAGESLEGFGNAIIAGGASIQAKEIRQQQIATDRQNRAWVSKTYAQVHRAWTEKLLQRQKEAPEGAPDFTRTFMDEYDAYRPTIEQYAPNEEARAALAAKLDGFGTQLSGNSIAFEAKAQSLAVVGAFSESVDQFANLLITDPSQRHMVSNEMMELLDNLKGAVTADTYAELKVKAQRTITEGAVKGEILLDPYRAIKELKEGVYDETLDPSRKAILINNAQTAINTLEAQAKAERTAQRKRLKDILDDQVDVMDMGFTPTGFAELGEALVAFDDPELLQEYEEAYGEMQQATAFALLPANVQQDVINTMRFNYRDKEVSPFEAGLLDRYEKIRNKQQEGLNKDSYSTVVRAGIVKNAAPLDWSNPDAESIMSRDRDVQMASAHYGQTISPFTNEETESLAEAWSNANVDGRLGIISVLSSLSERSLKKVAQEIAPKDTSLAASIAIVREDPSLSRLIVRGQYVRENNPEFIPERTDYVPEITEVYKDAFTQFPEMQRHLVDAAISVYVDGAWRRKETKDDFDSSEFEDALKLVAGGTIVNGEVKGGPFSWNGRQIIPPVRGMTKGEFDDTLEKLTVQDMMRWGMTVGVGNEFEYTQTERPVFSTGDGKKFIKVEDFISEAEFIQAGDGKYLVWVADGLLYNRLDKPYVIDLKGYMSDALR